LKAQFDPHFIFNTLNTLTYIAEYDGNVKISEAIDKMASLLRAVIYDFNEPIPLDHELKLIHQYIDLHKLKLEKQEELSVIFENNIDPSFYKTKIAPLILLPFVENALKHGFRPGSNSLIDIWIGQKNNRELQFKIKNVNYKDSFRNVNGAGIGLDNIKNRLQLLYPDHILEIQENQNNYIVDLSIKL